MVARRGESTWDAQLDRRDDAAETVWLLVFLGTRVRVLPAQPARSRFLTCIVPIFHLFEWTRTRTTQIAALDDWPTPSRGQTSCTATKHSTVSTLSLGMHPKALPSLLRYRMPGCLGSSYANRACFVHLRKKKINLQHTANFHTYYSSPACPLTPQKHLLFHPAGASFSFSISSTSPPRLFLSSLLLRTRVLVHLRDKTLTLFVFVCRKTYNVC